MKNFTTLSLGLVLSVTVCGQIKDNPRFLKAIIHTINSQAFKANRPIEPRNTHAATEMLFEAQGFSRSSGIEFPNRETFTYKGDGKVYEVTSWGFNNGIPFESGKRRFNYSNQKQLQTVVSYSYKDPSWEFLEIDSFIRDGNGNVITWYSGPWDKGMWDFTSKEELQYNGQNQLLQEVYYEYDNGWVPEWKTEFIYTNSKVTNANGYVWNADSSRWDLDEKISVKTNSDGKVTEAIVSDMDGGLWEDYGRYTTEYDLKGNTIRETEDFINDLGSWITEYDEYSTFDTSVAVADIAVPNWDYHPSIVNYNNPSKPLSSLVLELGDSNKMDTSSYEKYLYKSFSTGLEDFSGNSLEFKVYPNPTQGILNISLPNTEGASVLIMNSLGELVFEERIIGNASLNLNHISPGAYFLYVKSTTGTYLEKVLLD